MWEGVCGLLQTSPLFPLRDLRVRTFQGQLQGIVLRCQWMGWLYSKAEEARKTRRQAYPQAHKSVSNASKPTAAF